MKERKIFFLNSKKSYLPIDSRTGGKIHSSAVEMVCNMKVVDHPAVYGRVIILRVRFGTSCGNCLVHSCFTLVDESLDDQAMFFLFLLACFVAL